MNKRLLVLLICLIAIAIIGVVFWLMGLIPVRLGATPESPFIAAVNNWLLLKCVAKAYSPQDAFRLEYEIYKVLHEYMINGKFANAPIAQFKIALSSYGKCSFAVTQDVDRLINVINDSLRLVDEFARISGIQKSKLGTPTLIVYQERGEYAYAVIGADPIVLSIIRNIQNASVIAEKKDNVYMFKCDNKCRAFFKVLEEDGFVVGNGKVVLVEFLDPECPACAYFCLNYGDELGRLINDGVIKYVAVYFPTHTFEYALMDERVWVKLVKAVRWFFTS